MGRFTLLAALLAGATCIAAASPAPWTRDGAHDFADDCGGTVDSDAEAVRRSGDRWAVDVGGVVLRMAPDTPATDSTYVVRALTDIWPYMVHVFGPTTTLDTLTVSFTSDLPNYRCGANEIRMSNIRPGLDFDDDGDGAVDEDLFDGLDNDGDGSVDEDLDNSPRWDNLFIHELTHAYQDDLLCEASYPSWIREGMAEAGRYFVPELQAREFARNTRYRRFDARMTLYDLFDHTGPQIVGGRGTIAYRHDLDFEYQNAAGAILLPALAEIGAGRAEPHPMRRLTEALRAEALDVPAPHRMYDAIDAAWHTPIDGTFPPSRWIRARAIACASVRSGDVIGLAPVGPGANTTYMEVVFFNRSGTFYTHLAPTTRLSYTGVDGTVIPAPEIHPLPKVPELPLGAYRVDIVEPATDGSGRTLRAHTWTLSVHERFTASATLWDGIAAIFVDASGFPVDVPDLSVNGVIRERVPGGVIVSPNGPAPNGTLTFHGFGRLLGTVTVPGPLPRLVVIDVGARRANGVLTWFPYHPVPGSSVTVRLRRADSALDPAAPAVDARAVIEDPNGSIRLEEPVAVDPVTGHMSATFTVPIDLSDGVVSFESAGSRHGGCWWVGCDWLMATEFTCRPSPGTPIDVAWVGSTLRVRFDEPLDDTVVPELMLLVSESAEGPWVSSAAVAMRAPTDPHTIEWTVPEVGPAGGYARVQLSGRDLLVTSATGVAVPMVRHVAAPFPNPSARTVRWRIDIDRAADVRFQVFDVAGRRVYGPVALPLGPGARELWWNPEADGRLLPSGVYVLNADGGAWRASRKVILLPDR